MVTIEDFNGLYDLLKMYYTITGIRIGIFGNDDYEVVSYPTVSSAICRAIRSTDEGNARCIACDKAARKYVDEGTASHIYVCHAGLIDSIAPIVDDNGVIIGYIMYGQCIPGSITRDKAWENMKRNVADVIDISGMRKYFDELPQFPEQTLEALSKVMGACATYISFNHLIGNRYDNSFTRIRNYIVSHLDDKLSADSISKNLFLPRNEVYRAVKDETGISLGAYVRNKRLQYAQKLICNEDISITQVAERCGICDSNYFARVFKKNVGISPREYRNRASRIERSN